ncbi:hypothetical protein BDV27DRAFT_156931 [Aspergillus caelatus]|uniref:Uncharacterized protein n=1 Tax=Aspergillus caelatus TaxID=61420 RepID=A0A5N7AA14_9EURO|nr:uncharacterized protein BDV27DRAFT_156931 [Aspergillus caelatus]KAE8365440.1 hypothetical protein BDV27DRAFT_156931 [Aspergillus caelatus]
MARISIAQAVRYWLTDDLILKAVLLDKDGNERYKFTDYMDQPGVDYTLNSRKIWIHDNRKWGPRLCIKFDLRDSSGQCAVAQGLQMSKYFWNDNGTLRYNKELKEYVPCFLSIGSYPPASASVKKDYKRYEGDDLAAKGVYRAYGDYGDEDESACQEILESIKRRLDEEGLDVSDFEEEDAEW